MRKHTPRKVHDPMRYINNRITLANDQARDLGIAYHASLQAMLTGHGTEQAWSTLACSINIALVLAEKGLGKDSVEIFKAAQTALIESRNRASKLGKWGFDGSGMQQVKTAFAWHDEQIRIATKGQIVDSLKEVRRRIEAEIVFA